MRHFAGTFLVILLTCSIPQIARGQQAAAGDDAATIRMEKKVESISAALSATRLQLEESQRQIQQLQEELNLMRKQPEAASSSSVDASSEAVSQPEKSSDLQERVEALEEQVKLHDQTKVESSSKYPVRINGLILMNSFINRGAVDNIDLPSVAFPQPAGVTGSIGASLRQTILGIEGFGPRVAGAKTSANLSIDFYGGLPYSNFVTSAGVVRMRTASIHMDWERDSLEGGMETALISPLSPTSYAMVAEPEMAWAGNLWTWAPQLRYVHQFVGTKEQHLQVEAGLWDPAATGINLTDSFRVPSPSERSGQPGYEGRVSYGSPGVQGFQVGVGGYYSKQIYPTTTGAGTPFNFKNNSWAVTTDWRVPFAKRFEASGEGYRGQSLGGFGGGVYKDVIVGTDPVSGAPVIRGLNDIGGWTQLKSKFGGSVEANASIGQDNGFASDFHAVVVPATSTQLQLRARNRMLAANLIYRPKTYLIFSPEYRRIWTWPIYGTRSTANIFTLSVGYQF